VWVDFDEPLSLSSYYYYTIEIENLSDKVVHLGVVLFDSSGIGAFRTLPAVQPGKNLQIFNIVGFVERNGPLDDIARFELRFHPPPPPHPDVHISVFDMRKFTNTFALYNYLNETEFKIIYR
jgi:hypothetical protein